MTEAEWLICGKPDLMLAHVRRQFGLRALRRKNRLFICACCRLGWDWIAASEDLNAIEVAERYADGQATHTERDAARWKLRANYLLKRQTNVPQMLAIFACGVDNRLGDGAQQAAASLVQAWTEAALGPNAHQRPGSEWKQWQTGMRTILCNVVRDVFGNPFRPPSVDRLWLEWNDRTVPLLAQAIYEEHAFERLPILADALEEAGCEDAVILNHCRQPSVHARGCWVIDLLLGKS